MLTILENIQFVSISLGFYILNSSSINTAYPGTSEALPDLQVRERCVSSCFTGIKHK